MKKHKIRLSKISLLHCWKLVFRSLLFLLTAASYIYDRIVYAHEATEDTFIGFITHPYIMWFIWVVFAVEMLLRFFPSKLESPGCQKVFARNFIPVENPQPHRDDRKATWAILATWLGLNGVVAVLYFVDIIDAGILILIALAYSVCDMICILFFCPFQSWFLKNKCCGTCRIYNWDFAMMFTPLVLIPHFCTWSLLGIASALVINWEVVYHRHSERFYEESNQALACANCQEKLCAHKKQLRSLHRKLRQLRILK